VSKWSTAISKGSRAVAVIATCTARAKINRRASRVSRASRFSHQRSRPNPQPTRQRLPLARQCLPPARRCHRPDRQDPSPARHCPTETPPPACPAKARDLDRPSTWSPPRFPIAGSPAHSTFPSRARGRSSHDHPPHQPRLNHDSPPVGSPGSVASGVEEGEAQVGEGPHRQRGRAIAAEAIPAGRSDHGGVVGAHLTTRQEPVHPVVDAHAEEPLAKQ